MAPTSTQGDSLSSPSSIRLQWKYDVFLSFKGEDTRNTFTDHLYTTLKQKGIYTFRDDENVGRGKSISSTLLKAIEESRFAIIILSRNYASSTWCLDELAKIVGCMKEMKMTILPIFYDVDPSDVRKQTGTFAQTFAKHEECFKENIEKVQTWRAAMREVSNLSGWHLQNRPEAEFIKDIVEFILRELSYTFSIDTRGLVGINFQVEKLKSHLAIGLNDVRIIGIRGMGGMGKTTLARFVYDMISDQFEACSFIANVREVSKKCGLLPLQQLLLNELLTEGDMNIHGIDNGVLMIKNRLCHKRILLVLDDVNELDQLKKLAGERDWFGPGSRVIITTRDEHLLMTHKVDGIYEAKGLNYDEALHLFSLKAFHKDYPPKLYLNVSKHFVQYANGLPLAIEVLGSFLFNRSIDEWKSAFDRLKEFSERKILDVLQISFDGLHETEKEIFLYIACFFNQEEQDHVVEILDCLDLYPKIGLRVLIDKSLIKVRNNQLWMHDLLKEMGWDIVRQKCREEPGKHSRLWLCKDIDKVLTSNSGTKAIQGIVLKLPKPKEAHWNPKAFSKMHHLKLLIIHNVHLLHEPKHLSNGLRYLDWSEYPSTSLPSSFQPNELVGLRMCYSNIERFWKGTKPFDKLKFIQLSNSLKLIDTPDLTKFPNLEKLVVEGCINLQEIHPTTGVHKRLTILNLKGCKNLSSLPSKLEMDSLKILIISSCSKVNDIPEFMENMKCLTKLYLDGTAITKLPTSIKNLCGLGSLNLRGCKNLLCLPITLFNMKSLKDLNLSGCSKLDRLPENLGNAKSLEKLDMGGTAITKLPSSIVNLSNLASLNLKDCKNLVCLTRTICNMKSLKDLNLSGCSKLDKLLENLENAEVLEDHNTCGTINTKSIQHLTGLHSLNLRDCKNLVCLPSTIFNMKSLKDLNLYGCSKLEKLLENLGNAEGLLKLDASGTAIQELPSSIVLLKNLEVLSFCGCKGSSSSKSWYERFTFYLMPRSPNPIGLSLPSLSDFCSLIDLNLSHCNLDVIPNDIGCLLSLEYLDLSGNKFVGLPESIIQLSNLKYMCLENCRNLQSLPKVSLNINDILADNCTSLETLPDQLKPNDSFEPSLFILNCFKLADNQSCIDILLAVIRKYLQGISYQDRCYRYDLAIPGSEIPKWFSHQSTRTEVSLQEPSYLLHNEWMGIAICAVFSRYHPHDQFDDNERTLVCRLIANGYQDRKSIWVSYKYGRVLSDHLWLLYLFPQYFGDRWINKLRKFDAKGFIQLAIRIETMDSNLKVKKCGVRWVYKQDIEDLNPTMAY